MSLVYPKDFIRNVLIIEMQDVVIRHPYLAFILICSGIEFLGKCIDTKNQNWDMGNKKPEQPFFDNAIKKLFPQKYHDLLDKYELRDQLRNGLIHFLYAKSKNRIIQ